MITNKLNKIKIRTSNPKVGGSNPSRRTRKNHITGFNSKHLNQMKYIGSKREFSLF